MKNSIQDKLQALFLEYSKKLPTKIEEINKEWQQLKVSDQNPDRWEEFHRNVHSLCGSSAIYGYDLLSKSARKLEIFLKNMIDNKEQLNEKNKSEIETLLAEISSALTEGPSNKTAEVAETIQAQKVVETSTHKKVVYVVDDDTDFITNMQKDLDHNTYTLQQIKINDVNTTFLADKNNVVALLVNVSKLNKEEIKNLAELQKTQNLILPIICIGDDGSLETRLKAIRCGGKVFFQKPIESFRLSKTLDEFAIASEVEPYRVLIVDDSVSLSKYYSLILQEAGMITMIVNNPLDVMQTLAEFHPDLLLMDIYMPEINGLELAAVLRQQAYYTSLPIVFLSTEDDKFKQISTLTVGGDDFLLKPVQPQHLVSVIRSRAKRAGILSSYMTRDGLTGLLNHTTLFHELNLELSRAERTKQDFSFLIFDLDHFKRINDTYGHLVGDHVLRKLSEFLVTNLRKSDIVARYGGEEFGIILPKTTGEDAFKKADELRTKFALIKFNSNDQEFNVTLSGGVSNSHQFQKVDAIVGAADKSLYTAKNTGRNKIVLNEEK